MSRAATEPSEPSKSRRRAGDFAGLLALALLAGSLVGAVWGLFRRRYVGVAEDGALAVDEVASPPDVEFSSYGWFALLSAAVGGALAIVAFARRGARRGRGLLALAWVMVCALGAAAALYVFGEWSASLVGNSVPASGHDGETYSLVPPLHPGVAWLVGPFVSGLLFFTLSLSEVAGESAAKNTPENTPKGADAVA